MRGAVVHLRAALLAFIALITGAAACSTASHGGVGASSGGSSSGGDTSADGAAGAFSPAPHPPMPQIVTKGGPIIAAPRVVAVTFAGDALAPRLEAFVEQLAGSVYFAQIGADYGVRSGAALPPVRVGESAPASLSGVDVKSWLAGKLDGTHPELPAAASDVVYVLFYPAGTTITQNGEQSCDRFAGYHDETPVLGGGRVSFAVVARCTGLAGVPDPFDGATAAASHEIIETATNPLPATNPAFSDTDDDNPAWPLVYRGGEVADLCARSSQAYTTPPDFPYTVHRSWSNAAAKAGHDPCIPAPAGAYFASVPVMPDTVTLTVGAQTYHVRGVTIAPGASRTVDLALFSDAPADAWSIRALDEPAMNGGSPQLALDVSPATGRNRDVAKLTITVLARGPYGGEPFVIQSTSGARTTYAVGLVGE